MTKVPPKEVQKLAMDAKELFLGGMRNSNIIKRSQSLSSKRQPNMQTINPRGDIEEEKQRGKPIIFESAPLLSKRISKQRLKEQ